MRNCSYGMGARHLAVLAAFGLFAGQASAATFSYVATNNSQCQNSNGDNSGGLVAYNPGNSACFDNALVNDLNVTGITTGGTVSDTGAGTLNTSFTLDAAAASDALTDFTNEYQALHVNYSLTFTVDVDNPLDSWTLDIDQNASGFVKIVDDTSVEVGTQNASNAGMTDVNVIFDGNDYSLSTAASTSCGQGGCSSVFSDSNLNQIAGVGDDTINMVISFTLDAFSNADCSGFICSSANGGDEAAAVFGFNNVAGGGFTADETATGSEGYNGLFSLSITVPEPGTAVLLALSLLGLGIAGNRREG